MPGAHVIMGQVGRSYTEISVVFQQVFFFFLRNMRVFIFLPRAYCEGLKGSRGGIQHRFVRPRPGGAILGSPGPVRGGAGVSEVGLVCQAWCRSQLEVGWAARVRGRG